MGDDEAALLRLWREKRDEVEPEDLSGNLIVQLGTVTEDLSRRFAFKSSKRRGPPSQPPMLTVSLFGVAAFAGGRRGLRRSPR
jgi:hypothetical protein